MQETLLKSTPLVSVILPCYNNERYVEEAIRSLLDQTYWNIELIVLDDGSTDRTSQVIELISPLCTKRFINFVFVQKENEGVARTLNRGIKLAKGDYICSCDADDIYLPDRIQVLMDEFLRLGKDFAVVCGDADFIDESGRLIYRNEKGDKAFKPDSVFSISRFIKYYTRNRKDLDLKNEFGLYRSFIGDNYIPSMCTVIRRDVLFETGLYTPDITIEDLDMWFKISKKYKMKFVNRVVAHYRFHEQNTIRILKNPILLDNIKLILREKKYCYSNGLKDTWRDTYSRLLLTLLKWKKYKVFMEFMDAPTFLLFIWATLKRSMRFKGLGRLW